MSIQTVEAAAKAYADAYAKLRDEVKAAQQAGVPDSAIARAADITRQPSPDGLRRQTTSK